MRRFNLLLLSYLAIGGVHAVPLLQKRQGILEPVESFFNSAFGISTATTAETQSTAIDTPLVVTTTAKQTTEDAATAAVASTSPSTTTLEEFSTTKTITSETSSTGFLTSSGSSVSATSSTETSSSLTTSSTSTPILPGPTSPGNDIRPSPVPRDSGNSISTSGIVVAVIMSVAVVTTMIFIVLKFCPPVVGWRQKRAEEKRNARTYRPALDGGLPENSAQDRGLGLSYVEKPRPFSFLALQPPRQQIRRKPVPQPTWSESDVNSGTASLIGVAVPMGYSRVEKGLPAVPQEYNGPYQR